MVLQPLEFADCLADSPWFRQNLHEHEVILEETHKNIKTIELLCRDLVQCTRSKQFIHFFNGIIEVFFYLFDLREGERVQFKYI